MMSSDRRILGLSMTFSLSIPIRAPGTSELMLLMMTSGLSSSSLWHHFGQHFFGESALGDLYQTVSFDQLLILLVFEPFILDHLDQVVLFEVTALLKAPFKMMVSRCECGNVHGLPYCTRR